MSKSARFQVQMATVISMSKSIYINEKQGFVAVNCSRALTLRMNVGKLLKAFQGSKGKS